MTDADVFVDARDVELDPLSRKWLESDEASTTARKNVDILIGYAGRRPAGKRRRIVLRFLVSPLELLGSERVEGIRICRQRAARPGRPAAGLLDRHDRGARLRDSCSARSATAASPLSGLPFDERAG